MYMIAYHVHIYMRISNTFTESESRFV